MTANYNIIGQILFSRSLPDIRQKFELLRKDSFDPLDRIEIIQDIVDEYSYVDGVGSKLIAIQKIINQVDISNCFILLMTPNKDISREIDFVTKFYSVDVNPIRFQIISGDYVKTVKKYPNTACRKLWNHFYLGTDGNVNPCCLADHRFPLGALGSTDIIKNSERIRSDMTQGLRNRACAVCYEREDHGIRSMRQACDPVQQVVCVEDLDIRINNICNFKCRMCSEYFSSAIQQETIEIHSKDAVLGYEKISLDRSGKQIIHQRLDQILPLISNDLRSVYFAGGEPLIMEEHYEILDQLIRIRNTDLAIRYNTNLSTLRYKRRDVINQWQQFGDVTVGASIDASGAVAEYMRHGTVWSDVLDNIRIIKQAAPHVKLKISSVVSCLTIENLIDLQNTWIDQQLFREGEFEVNVLTAPDFLSPAVLPLHHKHRLADAIQKHIQRFSGTCLAQQWNDVLQWMNSNDYTFALKDFAHRIHMLDSHRNESFREIFPEFRDLA